MKRIKPPQPGDIPDDAVLLIPEPEGEGEPPTSGVQPGYYNAKQMLGLVEKHMTDPDAIQFIADMLETGDPDKDGFVQMLRSSCQNAGELARIVKLCKK